ncbi:TPA: hypothetical protein DEO28_05075 [Candidatus Dependentiae bacterium]|nr:MAG: hypothetical protein UR14_C0002G0128 [candidate division TM6 bacterium GW2011_GWE2_31_21]KKP53925.1 MAG: hypothetical protein UR43_C0002G0128 [candidate division TM6 bacterium GW2011_GWF2_33_332]HBS47705.1 hypothetical protein [Candidatus Dependentiae bacterium]HBZ73854.1 hypothetical protein [Candidatus Dependentiae bacterium]
MNNMKDSALLLSHEKLKFLEKYLQGSLILDVGCGVGAYSNWLVKNHPNLEIIALDQLENIFENDTITYIKSDLEQGLTLDKENFDTILTFDVIEHISNENFLLNSIFKKNKKGGILLGSVPHDEDVFLPKYNLTFYHRSDLTHKRYYTVESLSKLLQGNGFEIITIEKKGGVSPQVFAEFFHPRFKFILKKFIGIGRRIGLIKTNILYSDLFFAAKKL